MCEEGLGAPTFWRGASVWLPCLPRYRPDGTLARMEWIVVRDACRKRVRPCYYGTLSKPDTVCTPVSHCEGPAWGARFAPDGNNVTTTINVERRQCVGGEPRASQGRAGSVLRPESASLPSFLSLNKKEGRPAGSPN